MTLNKFLRKSHQMTDVRLLFASVTTDLQWMVCQNASWCNLPDDLSEQKNHHGSDRQHFFIEWSSRRIKRVVRSSPAAEVHGLSMGLDSAARARALWHELFVAEPLIVSVDCKSIYDHFVKWEGASHS